MCNVQWPANNGFPQAFVNLVDACLSFDPDLRPTMAEVNSEMASIWQGTTSALQACFCLSMIFGVCAWKSCDGHTYTNIARCSAALTNIHLSLY